MTNPSDDTTCRLCNGATTLAFSTRVLGRHEVAYYRCLQCESLQSEPPYWLAEAYADAAASIDPGSARRVLDSFALVDLVARLFKCRRLLDFGGNTGFLCRLLRDREYEAYCFDRYVTPTYAPHFVGSPSETYDLVSAFEVIEHFERPARDLEQLFAAKPGIVLATTELFSGQSSDWWYLAPREGQHVFFYSETGVRMIAERFGYFLLIGRGFLLFSRTALPPLRRMLARLLLSPRSLRVLGPLLLMKRGRGSEKDFTVLTQRTLAD